jgi:hypothetical protein
MARLSEAAEGTGEKTRQNKNDFSKGSTGIKKSTRLKKEV